MWRKASHLIHVYSCQRLSSFLISPARLSLSLSILSLQTTCEPFSFTNIDDPLLHLLPHSALCLSPSISSSPLPLQPHPNSFFLSCTRNLYIHRRTFNQLDSFRKWEANSSERDLSTTLPSRLTIDATHPSTAEDRSKLQSTAKLCRKNLFKQVESPEHYLFCCLQDWSCRTTAGHLPTSSSLTPGICGERSLDNKEKRFPEME